MRRTTLKDIAEKSGYNVSTVSRALGDSHEISEQTKKEIRDIAEQLKYTPDFSARALVGKGSDSIGVVLPEVRSDYYGRMATYIEMELRRNKYSMIIGLSEFFSETEERIVNVLISRNVDGILLTASSLGNRIKYLEALRKRASIPIILLDMDYDVYGFDKVLIDNSHGINQALSYFSRMNCKRIAYVGDKLSSFDRLPSFKTAITKNKLLNNEALTQVRDERFEEAGYLGMKEILNRERPDAVFASYDNVAIGALKAIYERGLRVPEDIMIVGYDNIREAEYLFKPLSTINPPIKKMARAATELLLERLNQPIPKRKKTIKFDTELIKRGTTR
jgi:LacI family transcriptional regulator